MAPSATPIEAQEPGQQASKLVTKGATGYQDDVHFLADKGKYMEAKGKIKLRSPPVFDTLEELRAYQKRHLAVAFRFFASQGFEEGVSGHISLRDPINPKHFWINPLSKHFAQMRVSDLVLVDEDGYVLPGGAQAPINGPAFAIHSQIHKARPDVNAACHAHTVNSKAFSAFGRPIEMIYQDALRFYKDIAVYNRFGGTVLSADEGGRIAQALGPTCKSVILQNHGMITCGATVDEAAFKFMCLDRCCAAQMLANAASVRPGWELVYINQEAAEFTHKKSGNPNKLWLGFQPYYDRITAAEPDVLE